MRSIRMDRRVNFARSICISVVTVSDANCLAFCHTFDLPFGARVRFTKYKARMRKQKRRTEHPQTRRKTMKKVTLKAKSKIRSGVGRLPR
jgi:hypothetical protein